MTIPRKKILIVDDQSTWLTSIKTMLLDSKVDLVSHADLATSGNALDAISMARANDFDLIIMDQILPKMLGIDALKKIRSFKADQEAIIISGDNLSDKNTRDLAKMAVEFVYKDGRFRPELVEKVRWHFERDRNPVKVFISYTKDNAENAMMIFYRLRDNSFIPWIDRINLEGIDPWDVEIERVINENDYFVSCVSEGSIKRRSYFRKEKKIALVTHDRSPPFIVPLLFNNVSIPPAFAKRKIHCISYDWPSEVWWQKLKVRLSSKRANKNDKEKEKEKENSGC